MAGELFRALRGVAGGSWRDGVAGRPAAAQGWAAGAAPDVGWGAAGRSGTAVASGGSADALVQSRRRACDGWNGDGYIFDDCRKGRALEGFATAVGDAGGGISAGGAVLRLAPAVAVAAHLRDGAASCGDDAQP